MITLISPTRNRPEGLKRMWESAQKAAFEPHKLAVYAGIDADDVQSYRPFTEGGYKWFTQKDWGVVHVANSMAEALIANTDAKLFMIAPDDVLFTTLGWDRALIDHYESLENKAHVYCLRDSRDANGTPHPILTREYILLMGYFFPPIFLHWYVDSWTAEIAKANGIFTHLMQYDLVHDKPSDKGRYDETHMRVRDRGWHERDTYVAKTCAHFLHIETERLRLLMQHTMGLREHVD